MFCKHDYEVIVKTVGMPRSIERVSGGNLERLERLIHGVTSVMLKCKKCNNVVIHEMIGIEKVE